MRKLLLTIIVLEAVWAVQCNNYELSAKFENPGGTTKVISSINVVSTNITTTLSTGGTFNATVTFSRAVNIPNGSITINNGATIMNLTTTDNVTWTFDINGLTNSGYTIMFSSAISDSSGATLIPFSVTFTNTLA